jgi:hypothetical protein
VSCSPCSCFPLVLIFATRVFRADRNQYCTRGPSPPWSCLSSNLFPHVLVLSWIKVEWIWHLQTHLYTWTNPNSEDVCSCVYHVDIYVFTLGLFERSPEQFLIYERCIFL